MTGTPFYKKLIRAFPSAAEEIKDDDLGLLHVEMAGFARMTESAIARGDWETVKNHFAFVEGLLDSPEPDLGNAIFVSYIEHVILFPHNPEKSQETQDLMGPRARKGLEDLRLHFEKLKEAQDSKDNG